MHACRHIAESKLGQLKIRAHIRDMLFDHASGRGAGAVYDHHEYADELRTAVDKWAEYVERLVQPAGVKMLR